MRLLLLISVIFTSFATSAIARPISYPGGWMIMQMNDFSINTLQLWVLPVLFVALGPGAALAGLVSTVPWLVALSEYKVWVFSIAGIMILIGGVCDGSHAMHLVQLIHYRLKLVIDLRK